MLGRSACRRALSVHVRACRGMFNKEVIGKMKKGAFLVNNARGSICDTDAVKEALESGHLAGCACLPGLTQ